MQDRVEIQYDVQDAKCGGILMKRNNIELPSAAHDALCAGLQSVAALGDMYSVFASGTEGGFTHYANFRRVITMSVSRNNLHVEPGPNCYRVDLFDDSTAESKLPLAIAELALLDETKRIWKLTGISKGRLHENMYLHLSKLDLLVAEHEPWADNTSYTVIDVRIPSAYAEAHGASSTASLNARPEILSIVELGKLQFGGQSKLIELDDFLKLTSSM